MKKTLILGATTNPDRYAFKAAQMLTDNGHEIVPVGVKRGDLQGVPIQKDFPSSGEIDTVTLYVNPNIQEQYYESILKLHPKRIVFNPGTENEALRQKVEDAGIDTEYACTLVLLSSGQY